MKESIEIQFISSSTTEAVRYINTSYEIYRKFYYKNGFYVLPYFIDGNISHIYYPRIEHQIDNFWDKIDDTYSTKFEDNESFIIRQLTPFFQKVPESIKSVNEFTEIFNQIWPILKIRIPKLILGIKKIKIYPTYLGSVCTQYSHLLNDDSEVKVFARVDASIREIIRMIVFERICREREYEVYTWSERMAITEFIINERGLNYNNMPKIHVLSAIRMKKEGKIYKDSIEYLKELGFKFSNELNSRQGEIYWENKLIRLTEYENRLVNLLLEKKEEIVTYDEIAKKIWEDEHIEKFSLEAITQLVKRVRKKFVANNIKPQIIQSVPKKGYILS